MWKKIEFILLFSIGLCFHSIAQQEIDAFFDSRPSEDSLKVIPGMFTTYRQGEQIFWEIPDSLLGCDMFVTTTILESAAVKKRDEDRRYGYSGDFFGPMIVCFRKEGDEVLLQVPLCDRVGVDPGERRYSSCCPTTGRFHVKRGVTRAGKDFFFGIGGGFPVVDE